MAEERSDERSLPGRKIVQHLLGQGAIAVPRGLARLIGSANATLLVTQLIYWSDHTNDARGWFFKTQDELQSETGLSRDEQRTARHRLRALGLIEEREWGVPNKLHFRVIWPNLIALLEGDARSLPYIELIKIYRPRLNRIAGVAYSRALKISRTTGCKVERVDYCEVLTRDAGLCYWCHKSIARGPGNNDEDLAFDHIISLKKNGGDHVLSNVKAMHAGCNRRKETEGSQSSENQRTQSSDNLHTGSKKISTLVVGKTEDKWSVNQRNKIQETTAQTTSQKTLSSTCVENFVLTPPGPPDPGAVVGEDPRFEELKPAIQKCWPPGVPLDWSLKDSRALRQLLRDNPTWSGVQLVDCIIFRFLSDDCSKTETPAEFLKRLIRYADGPLNTYGRPKEPGGLYGRAHWRAQGLRLFFGEAEAVQLALPTREAAEEWLRNHPEVGRRYSDELINLKRALVGYSGSDVNPAFTAAIRAGIPEPFAQALAGETPKRPAMPALGLPDRDAEEG